MSKRHAITHVGLLRLTARRSRDMDRWSKSRACPEKHVLDPDRGWTLVFGKDHAPPI